MTALSAVLLGIIQGVAEFLPISSSGHLSVIQNIFGLNTAEEGHMFFDVLLHFGTLVSVCVFYRKDIGEMLNVVFGWFSSVGKRGTLRAGIPNRRIKGKPGSDPAGRLILMIIIATLPLFIVLPIHDKIEQLYYNTIFIGIALLLTGFMLYVSDKMTVGAKTEKNMKAADALLIGVCQAIATIPGLSRSGTTITAGIATGQSREYAVRFSFLMSLPAIIGANILSVVKAVKSGFDTSLLPIYLLGMLAAAVVGYLAIMLVRLIVSRGKFGFFAYYCWFAGVLTIILSLVF